MSMTFADLGVSKELCAALAATGITEPFPVQAATIPDALSGRDVCGRAPTGSGKTLAFGLPLLSDLGPAERRRPRALVLAPTRELAAQIRAELDVLARAVGRRTLVVHGGVGYGGQRSSLAKGVDVLIACPGRLEDLVQQGSVDLGGVDRVVIDEADRMADMGFLPAVRRLLDATSPDRQTLLFSATLDSAVCELGKRYQRDAALHDVIGVESVGDVQHELQSVTRDQRVAATAELIGAHPSTIVFCRTRRGVDRLVRHLERLGLAAVPIHGGRTQNQRDRALASFTKGRATALVATDVAARGIHVDGVSCVLHHDPAPDLDTYVHRSGRTGRAGARGTVVTLVTDGGERSEMKRILRSVPGASEATSERPAAEPRAAVAAKPSAIRSGAGRPERKAKAVGNGRAAKAGESRGRRIEPSTAEGQLRGKVKFFDKRRGFGFIAHADRGDVFFHHSQVSDGIREGIRDGQHVGFEIEQGRRGDEARRVVGV